MDSQHNMPEQGRPVPPDGFEPQAPQVPQQQQQMPQQPQAPQQQQPPQVPQVVITYVDHEGNPIAPPQRVASTGRSDEIFFATSATNSSGEITPGQHHVHPLTLAENVMKTMGSALIFLAIGVVPGLLSGSFDFQNIMFAVLALAMAALGGFAGYITYRYFTWELAPDTLILRKGFINKQSKQIPYEKIHSINMQSSATQRILGLADMEIDTGASSSSGMGGEKIPSMKLADAEALKREIFARKRVKAYKSEMKRTPDAAGAAVTGVPGAAAAPTHPDDEYFATKAAEKVTELRGILAGDYADDEPVVYHRKLTKPELLLASASNASVSGIIAALMLLLYNIMNFGGGILDRYLGIDRYIEGLALDAYQKQELIMAVIKAELPRILVIVVAILLFMWVISAIFSSAQLAGFEVTRRANRFEVSRGLISRRSDTAALNRVQSVVIAQKPFQRMLGYATITVQLVKGVSPEAESSGNQQQSSGVMLHPFIKVDQVPAFLNQAIPEYADIPSIDHLYKLPPIALRRKFVRSLMALGSTAVPVIIVWYLSYLQIIPEKVSIWVMPALWTLLGFMAVVLFVHNLLSYRLEAIGHGDKHLVTVEGALAKVITIMHKSKMQLVTLNTTWFQRRKHISTMLFHTASGYGSADLRMADVRDEDAYEIVEWIRPTYGDTQLALKELAKQDLLTPAEESQLAAQDVTQDAAQDAELRDNRGDDVTNNDNI